MSIYWHKCSCHACTRTDGRRNAKIGLEFWNRIRNEWQQQCIWCKSNEQNVMNMMATVKNTMAIVIDSMTNVMNAMAIKMNTMATIIVITLLWASACMKMNSHFLKMAIFGSQQIYKLCIYLNNSITSYKSKAIVLTFPGYYFPTLIVCVRTILLCSL